LQINKERLWDRVQHLGEIGQTDEGITRLAFSSENQRARNLVIKWMEDIGLKLREDEAGNIFGRYNGEVDNPVILTGSHLDTVINGGKFDGAAGVISSLECLQVMKENNIKPKFPIEIVIFVNEEGVRFPGGLMGSKAVTGLLDSDYPYKLKDRSGKTLAESMKKYWGRPDKIIEAKRKKGETKAFYELHVEQGRKLEQMNKPVGIVSAIAGPHQLELKILGEAGHAGTVPMEERKDPVLAFAYIRQKVEELIAKASSQIRGTVGYIEAFPGAHNVIPSKTIFTLDFRDINEKTRDSVIDNLKEYIDKLCHEKGLKYRLETTQKTSPVVIDKKVRELMVNEAENAGINYEIIPSWAAHDAMVMSNICKVGMIFIRSKEGRSHCPEEFSSKEDLSEGTNLLFNILCKEAT